MTTNAPIVDRKLNLKMNQETLDRAYLEYQCDTFKANNVSVHQILSKVFTHTDKYRYVKQRKSTQDG